MEDSTEYVVPTYLIQTAYGEKLQQTLRQPSTPASGLSTINRLSTAGVMGTMPGRYADYNEELTMLLSRNAGVLANASNRAVPAEPDEGDVLTSVRFNEDLMDLEVDPEDDEPRVERPTVSPPTRERRYPLPLKWDLGANSPVIISENGLKLKLDHKSQNGVSANKTYDIKCAKTDTVIPINCGIFYYEVKVTNVTNNNYEGACDISIGFMISTLTTITKAPGMETGSYGFHGSDGNIYANQSLNDKYSKKFGLGDIIGCGVNYTTKTIFFTKNGVSLGTAFKDVTKPVYAVIGLKDGNGIMTNFGQDEFIFNIEGYVLNEKKKVMDKIMNHITEPDDIGVNIIREHDIFDNAQELISSYFDHLGYVDVSRTFQEEIGKENEDDDDDPHVTTASEENLLVRQQIRNYLLSGDIDNAILLTRMRFPRVFEQNDTILFQLNCNKFIQLIKQSEIDDAIKFGQSLRAQFSHLQRSQEFLNDIFSLLAYEDPAESEFGFLLKDDEILKVSDELNGEILRSMGKQRTSALQRKIQHAKELLATLSENKQPEALLITNADLGI